MALEICPLKSAAMKLCDQTAECLLELKKSVEWQRISRSQYGYNFCNSRLSLPSWVKKSWICLRGAGVRLGMKRCLPVTSLLYGCRGNPSLWSSSIMMACTLITHAFSLVTLQIEKSQLKAILTHWIKSEKCKCSVRVGTISINAVTVKLPHKHYKPVRATFNICQ